MLTETNNNLITLYHNTSNENAIKIAKEGIKGGLRLHLYGKESEAEGAGVWCTTERGYGYGGATITFQIDKDTPELKQQNDTEYIVYRDIKPEEIIDIDLMISDIHSTKRKNSITSTMESDIPDAIKHWGKEKVINVLCKNPQHFIYPYNEEQLLQLIETGEKYCKGNINLKRNNLIENKRYDFSTEENLINYINSLTYAECVKLYSYIEPDSYYRRRGNKRQLCIEKIKDAIKNEQETLFYNLQKWFNPNYITLYHFTTIDKFIEIKKNNNLLFNENREICCTENPNFMNFQNNPNIVRLSIDTFRLPSVYLLVRQKDKTDVDFVESENEWVIDGTNSNFTGIRLDAVGLFKVSYSPSLQDNNVIANELRQKLKNNNLLEGIRQNNNLKITKLEEVSRNELLAKSKQQTITRYNKSAGYKGFSIVDIDTTSVLTTDSLRVTCRVGDYFDTVEVEDILYWVQYYAEQNEHNQINTKVVTKAIMDAIDAMTIKVDCNCGDFKYRFAYLATKMGYKYGKPENRPAKITNPNDYGAMCKHLISMLSNKKWLQQVTGTFMDFLEKRIEEVNRYLRVRRSEELTLPNELARQNAKVGAYSKLFKDIDNEEEVEDNDNNDNNGAGTNDDSNTDGDAPDNTANMDDVADNKADVENKGGNNTANNVPNNRLESEDETNG